jgi:hypothetical protein
MEDPRAGIFLSVDELLDVFPRFKYLEAGLGEGERAVLRKMEKTLYENLSIDEIQKVEQRVNSFSAPREVICR